jgi:hypothetical protein
MLGKSPINEFLIDCSFKSYSRAPKFDQLIPRCAILIFSFAAKRGILVQRYVA